MNWYVDVLKKYAVFDGRARRKEYWMFALFNLIVACVLAFVEGMVGLSKGGYGPLSAIYLLATFLPALGVSIRRLHDTGKSGWWILIGAIPLLGALVILFFMIQDSKPGSNQYGPNPKGA